MPKTHYQLTSFDGIRANRKWVINLVKIGDVIVNLKRIEFQFFGSLFFLVTLIPSTFADDEPWTNWGAVLKVPVEQSQAIEQVLINWGNWIKETHPLDADDKNNLEYLSITKGEPIGGHIYYVIVEVYPTNAGLMNHQRIYGETSGTEKYKDVFSKLRSVAGPYFVGGATQRYSVYKLVPSKQR